MSSINCIQSLLTRSVTAGLLLGLGLSNMKAMPLTITIPQPAPIGQVELGQGSSVAPNGATLAIDGCSLLLNGRPIMPVAGEFHYSRYPREEWRVQLLRMKAQGITVVSTYVFWIHHQETQDAFNWSDRHDLRHFVSLCGELGLQAIVRIGPWNHGEVRNGGLPDWVQHSGLKIRSLDPAFMALVRPFYAQIAEQIDGLFWKSGGPIIAVQLENECDDPDYLLGLKQLARELGIDAPYYTMTGWNGVRIPEAGLLPLFGAYSTAFWYPYSRDSYKKSFFHTDIRDDGDMGAQFVNTRPQRVGIMNRFPYICCEIGGGMPSSYTKRIKVVPEEISAMSLVKLGNGSNMPGYYMYQGGFNPEGRLSYLHETKPNAMPVKDYDFQAPLGASGLARPHAHLLRRQHLFIKAHGETLARMPLVLPEKRPTSIQDTDTMRWALRDNGREGFLFLNNYEPLTTLPAKPAQQFLLRRPGGEQLVPATPIDIPSGAYGVLPLNMNAGGLLLRYATVDPLGSLSRGRETWLFFGEIAGLRPEMAIDLEEAGRLPPGTWTATGKGTQELAVITLKPSRQAAFSLYTNDGGRVHFVILPTADAEGAHRVNILGHEGIALSPSTLHVEGAKIVLESTYPHHNTLSVFIPALQTAAKAGESLFSPAPLAKTSEQAGLVSLSPVSKPELQSRILDGRNEADWELASEWRLDFSAAARANTRCLLRLSYKGEALRLYAGDRLLMDNYFNGDPMELPLWRIPAEARDTLRVRIIPLAPDAAKRLPPSVAPTLSARPSEPEAQLLSIHHAEADFKPQQ